MSDSATQLQEIKDLISSIARPEKAAVKSVSDWVSGAQNTCSPKINHARLSLFFAHHGFARTLKITDPSLDKYVKGNLDGTGRLNRLAQSINTDLRLYEMDLENPTHDALSGESAMETEDLVKSIAYGMMAVEPGLDLMAVTAFGDGSEASAKALLSLHTGNACDDLTCTRLLKANTAPKGFESLRQIGGYELAALCGVVIAARLAHVPVLLEGITGAAILSVLNHENAGITDHCALTGWDDAESKQVDAPYFATPHPTPKEPGVALACQIPSLKNQLILASA